MQAAEREDVAAVTKKIERALVLLGRPGRPDERPPMR
jgi:hypothetical protein